LPVGRRRDRRRHGRSCWACWPRRTAAGRPDEALRLLDEALAQVNRTGERFFEAELHRLKGESLLAMSPLQAHEAETALATSIAVARRQGAKLLEDRATTSLDRLRAARRPQSSR
jgi:predicted ATPase